MDKIWFKEGPNMGQIMSQNYLFGKILTNHGDFELKLDQYLYLYGMYQKIKTFSG